MVEGFQQPDLQGEAQKRYSNAIAEGDALPPTTFKVTQLDPANNPAHKVEIFSLNIRPLKWIVCNMVAVLCE